MIIVDDRIGSQDLAGRLSAYPDAPPIELDRLEFGDIAFAGNGPTSDVTVGIEVKTVPDVVNCIIGGRFAGHQLPGLVDQYQFPYLLVEGVYRGNLGTGVLEVPRANAWKAPCDRLKLTGYLGWLTSVVTLAGVFVRETHDRRSTGDMIMALYRWFQKPWDAHDTLKVIYQRPRPGIHLGKKRAAPTQVERVAATIDGIGWDKAALIGERFKSVRDMVDADEAAWLEIYGIGKVLAAKVRAALGAL